MNIKKLLPAGFTLLLGLSLTSIAAAQAPAPQQADPNQPPAVPEQAVPQAEFSDADLQTFVDLQFELEEIRGDYTARLEQAEDQTAAAALQQEASEQMVETVESSDIDVATYSQIAQALQQDPALQQRVQEMMMNSQQPEAG